MRIFVAGATGELGRAAIPHLIAAGHDVVGSARGDANAGLLRSLGADPGEVDLYDLDGLTRTVSGCDAVIRLTTKIPPLMAMRNPRAWVETNRLRTEGARLLVEAAKAAGCGTYVTESITFPYAEGGRRCLADGGCTGRRRRLVNVSGSPGERGASPRFHCCWWQGHRAALQQPVLERRRRRA